MNAFIMEVLPTLASPMKMILAVLISPVLDYGTSGRSIRPVDPFYICEELFPEPPEPPPVAQHPFLSSASTILITFTNQMTINYNSRLNFFLQGDLGCSGVFLVFRVSG